MTRGHRGSLLLRCRALPSPPPCRFIPAHPQFPGQPSDRSTPLTPEGPSTPAPEHQVSSMAFAVAESARHPLDHPKVVAFDDACAGFARAADRPVASTLLRTRPLSHARGFRYQGLGRLLGPDLHRQAALSLSLGYVTTTSSSP